jgi:NADH-quinone oxidoreductase subunit H
LQYVFNFVVFPGFLFLTVMGFIVSWVDRKVSARVQWRVGPPISQPLVDFLKLMGKEVIVPEKTSALVFLGAALVGLAGATLAGTIVYLTGLTGQGFVGDLIVVIYLLLIPSIAIIVGGSASRNPLSTVGASRETTLMLAYELPFILALLVPVIKSGGDLRLSELAMNTPLYSISGVIACIIALIALQAKLTLVPFDIPEAETEIMSGPFVEYSGAPLGVFKLMHEILFFVAPGLLTLVFWGGLDSWWAIPKIVLFLVLFILIKNTNPRLRIDQALKFFWIIMTSAAVVAVVLALYGL